MATTISYLTVASPTVCEIVVKRSRFLCHLEPVADETEARTAIAHVRAQHRDARHHCSAFIIGERAMTRRSNDDGEPSGTAGAPILEALAGAHQGEGVTFTLGIVTRWFGGTLLGTGGLTRAYGDATREALAQATLKRMTQRSLYTFTARHADAARIENGLRHNNIHVQEVQYLSGHAQITIGVSSLEEVQEKINQLATKDVDLTADGTAWIASPPK